ncbi:hypothetical protein HUS70_16860 [Pandoraea nosoerga]|uniref:hypothetical protein n=1 Tax=Pandoraea nosoerga TaxID=2508296 RepID=UPI00198155EF|nr:hypothetical protein [Pandoraea nosoerga]MBN4667224.1 hypothetical protein [Pandoraea nosoerga]MBN4677211.1 hypothetical protein [Pandoraea nosoerga]MBN4681967.1 hypothetical protein [Pandoraea nosoerga]MBN4746285.1 hypothetical protein [Pandoraea nosoerga]
MPDAKPVVRQLNFDLRSMQEKAELGVRRAAAFLGISERMLEQELPRSLTLGRAVRSQFLPDPIPEEAVDGLRENWRAWITGNALRELDQFLSLYLDAAYDFVQQAKVYSGEHAPNYVWRRIDGQTNVADKYRDVLTAMGAFDGVHIERHDCLETLSKARNCLSHDLGIVTPKRVTDGVLSVRWISIQTVMEQSDRAIVLDDLDAIEDLQLNPEEESHLKIWVVLKKREFAVGDHMHFTPDELLQLCLFYRIVFSEVGKTLTDFVRRSGVPFQGDDE